MTREISERGGGGVEGSATTSFGEYEFNAFSSVETEVIVVGPGADMVEFGNLYITVSCIRVSIAAFCNKRTILLLRIISLLRCFLYVFP